MPVSDEEQKPGVVVLNQDDLARVDEQDDGSAMLSLWFCGTRFAGAFRVWAERRTPLAAALAPPESVVLSRDHARVAMTGLAMMAQWRLTEDGGALAREAFETIKGQVLMSAEKAEGT